MPADNAGKGPDRRTGAGPRDEMGNGGGEPAYRPGPGRVPEGDAHPIAGHTRNPRHGYPGRRQVSMCSSFPLRFKGGRLGRELCLHDVAQDVRHGHVQLLRHGGVDDGHAHRHVGQTLQPARTAARYRGYDHAVPLPEGTVIAMRYVYDNSDDNVANPNHPPQRVTGGNRSSDEMAHLWLQVLPRKTAGAQRDPRMILQEALARHHIEADPSDFESHYNLGAMLQAKGDATFRCYNRHSRGSQVASQQ